MATDTFYVYAAAYDSVEAAEADYTAVGQLHRDLGLMDFYDAAVLQKVSDGDDTRVKILHKHESAEWVDAGIGAAVGVGVGLLVAALPAVLLTGGLVVGSAAAGGAIGALTGHVTNGISRGDLKELGDVLGAGQAGVVVLAGVDAEKRMDQAIASANQVVKKEIRLDRDELDKELREIEKSIS